MGIGSAFTWKFFFSWCSAMTVIIAVTLFKRDNTSGIANRWHSSVLENVG